MDGYTVVTEVEETSEQAAARWAAYNAETDRMIRALKLSQPMKDALSLWISQSRNNSVMLSLPPVKPVTMEALEKRGLVKAYRTSGWKLTREDMGTGADGARIARRIASLDGSIVAAWAAQVRDQVKAVQAHKDAEIAKMLTPIELPEIAGHSWKEYRERNAYPGSPTDALLGWQLIPDGKAVTVAASIMRREGKWLANGYRSGMSALLSPTWEGTSLADAGALIVDNIMMRSCASCDGRGRRIGSWREDCDHVPMPAVATHERAGDAERAFDAENARLEGASIEAEQLAEVEFDDTLTRLGMDMDDYAECVTELAQERSGCSDCDPDDVNRAQPCKIHASVEAWVNHMIATDASLNPAPVVQAARVTTFAWKTSSVKGKRGKAVRGWRK